MSGMNERKTVKPVAYPEPMDAIVLAGTDDNPKRMIQGQNKAFLDIGGRALVLHVVEALLSAETVDHVFVVGPEERLKAVLEGLSPLVNIIPQKGRMLANAWAAIRGAEAHQRERGKPDDPQRPLLVLSCDLPLISGEAVDDFVARCAVTDSRAEAGYAMLCGVAEEASLKQYYADGTNPGIRRPYVNFAENRVRLANIYVGRPRTLTNQKFLQTGFEHRKAAKLKNVLLLAWDFLSQPSGWLAAWLSLRMQATLVAERRGWKSYEKLRAGNSAERTEQVCSRVLGGPVKMVITPYGGLSLDADNEEDFRVLSERYEEWLRVPPVES